MSSLLSPAPIDRARLIRRTQNVPCFYKVGKLADHLYIIKNELQASFVCLKHTIHTLFIPQLD